MNSLNQNKTQIFSKLPAIETTITFNWLHSFNKLLKKEIGFSGGEADQKKITRTLNGGGA